MPTTTIASLRASLEVDTGRSEQQLDVLRQRLDALQQNLNKLGLKKPLIEQQNVADFGTKFRETVNSATALENKVKAIAAAAKGLGVSESHVNKILEDQERLLRKLTPLTKEQAKSIRDSTGASSAKVHAAAKFADPSQLLSGEVGASLSDVEKTSAAITRKLNKLGPDVAATATKLQSVYSEYSKQLAHIESEFSSKLKAINSDSSKTGDKRLDELRQKLLRLKDLESILRVNKNLTQTRMDVLVPPSKVAAARAEFQKLSDEYNKVQEEIKKVTQEEQNLSKSLLTDTERNKANQLAKVNAAFEQRKQKILGAAQAERLSKERTQAQSEVTDKLNSRLRKLSNTTNRSVPPLNKLSKAASNAKKHTNDLAQAANTTSKATIVSKRQLTDAEQLAVNLRNLSSALVVVNGPLSGVGSRITALSAILNRSNFVAVGLFGAFAVGTTVLTKFIRSAIDVRRELEAMQNLLDRLDKVTNTTASTFDFLIESSRKYGLALADIAKPLSKLAIAMRSSGVGDSFKQVSANLLSVISRLGLTKETINGTIKAIEQMLSKGRVFAEELRQQLGDRIPGAALAALQAYRQMIGNTSISMSKFISDMRKGRVEAATFVPIFVAKLRDLVGANPAKETDNLNASINRFSTNLQILTFRLDKATGATDAIKSVITAASDALKILGDNTNQFSKTLKGVFAVVSLFGAFKLAGMFIKVTRGIKAAAGAATSLQRAMQAVYLTGTLAAGATGVAATSKYFFGSDDQIRSAAQRAQSIAKSALPTRSIKIDTTTFGNQKSVITTLQRLISEFNTAAKSKTLVAPTSTISQITQQVLTDANRAKIQLEDRLASLNRKADRADRRNKQDVATLNRTLAARTQGQLSALVNSKDLKTIRELSKAANEAQIKMLKAAGALKEFHDVSIISRAFASLALNIDKVAIALGTAWAAVKVFNLTSSIHGIKNFSAAISLLVRRIGKFKASLVGAALAAGVYIAAQLTFTSDVEAAEAQSNKLILSLQQLKRVMQKTGKIPIDDARASLLQLNTQISANRQLLQQYTIEINTLYSKAIVQSGDDGVVAKAERLAQALKEASTAVERLQLKEASGISFEVLGLIHKAEKLKAEMAGIAKATASLQNEASQFATAVGFHSKAAAAALRQLQLSTSKSAQALERLNSKLAETKLKISDLNNPLTESQLFMRSLNAEMERLEISATKSGAKIEVVADAIRRLKAARIELFQKENEVSANNIIESTTNRFNALRSGNLQQFDRQQQIEAKVKKLTTLLQNAGTSTDEITRKTATYRNQLNSLANAHTRVSSAVKQQRSEFSKLQEKMSNIIAGPLNSFADKIAELAVDGKLNFKNIGDAFKSMARSIIKDISAMIIKINILNPLMKTLNGGSLNSGSKSSPVGLLTNIIGGLNGIGGKTSFFAKGGVVNAPTPFMFNGSQTGVFGEAGSEAILPLRRGPDGTLGVATQGQSQQPINITFNVQTPNPDGFRQSQGQLAAMLSKTVSSATRYR